MSRIKTYYNESEIVTDLYTFGKEWQLQDGTEYIGLYHKYISTGEVYTNPVWNISLSKQLTKYQETKNNKTVPYKKLKPNLNVSFKVPTEIYPEPNTDDIARTYFIRYFIKKQNEPGIIEIDKTQYELWVSKKIDPILYTAVAIKWFITGPRVTTIDNNTNIRTDGIIDKNIKAVQMAERTIPGIKLVLNNYTQFYTDTDYIIPDDINSVSSWKKRIAENASNVEARIAYISLAKETYTFNSKLSYNEVSIVPKTYYFYGGYLVEDNINTDGYLLELSDQYVGNIQNENNQTTLYSNYKAATGTSFKFKPVANLPQTRKTFIKVTCLTTNKTKFIDILVEKGTAPFANLLSSDTGDAGIVLPNGQAASNDMILQIRKTLFIDVNPISYTLNTTGTKSIFIRPVTKHKDITGQTVQNDNITAYYAFELVNNKFGQMINESSGRVAPDLGDGISSFVAPSVEIKPNYKTNATIDSKVRISALPLAATNEITIPLKLIKINEVNPIGGGTGTGAGGGGETSAGGGIGAGVS